ncbi:MAG: DUF2798 domain-containing protein [Gloeocapsa sp. UFS-A4-WI-NPMV-4B04]|nr:DUF2798 domain-containing protein [Gloeocapsa sp. UFS-A4-WI-NPMV-4B04]
MKIPKRYAPLLFAAITAGCVSFLLSGVFTLINLGFSPDFISRWLQSFLIAYCIALPTVMIVVPYVRKLVGYLISE